MTLFYKPKKEKKIWPLVVLLVLILAVFIWAFGRAVRISDNNYCASYPDAKYCQGLK